MTYGEKITNSEMSSRPGLDLLARMIYAEAEGEREIGKRAVACVARNRKDHAKASEFGGTTYKEVILKPNQFTSVGNNKFLEPDLDSTAWSDSLDIALNMDTVVNPISACLWFNTNSLYNSRSRIVNGQEQYTFSETNPYYQDVIQKGVVGNHTFFRLSGY